MVSKKFYRSALFLLVSCFLIACADRKADFEKAEYFIGKGNATSGEKAARLIEPYLSSTDISIRMKAVRLYAGAKFVQAGFTPSSFISRLIERDSSQGTIQTFKNALGNIADSEAARSSLFEAYSVFQALYALEGFTAIDATSDADLVREKKAVYLSDSLNLLLYALIVGSVDSNLVEADLNDEDGGTFVADCVTSLTTDDANFDNEDSSDMNLLESFVHTLRESRVRMINAGLSDNQQKNQALDDTPNELSTFAGTAADSANNKVNDFIQDLQVEVDSNYNGIPGSADNETGDEYSAEDLCDYLNSNERGDA